MASVSGVVLGLDGKPLANAPVRLYRRDNGSFLASTETSDGQIDPHYDKVELYMRANQSAPGNVWKDESKNNFNLEAKGNVSLNTDGKFRNCLRTNFLSTSDISYINVDNTDLFNLGSKDFTIETWVRIRRVYQDGACIIGNWTEGSNPGTNWLAHIDSSRNLGIFPFFPSAVTIKGHTDWQHIAITRKGSTFRIFNDGVEIWSGQNSQPMPWNKVVPTRLLSWGNNDPPQYLSGALDGDYDELRVTIGVCRYESNFPVQTKEYPITGDGIIGEYKMYTNYIGEAQVICLSPVSNVNDKLTRIVTIPDGTEGDFFFNDVSLLMHFEGTDGSTVFNDNSKYQGVVSAYNGAQIKTNRFKQGTSSGEIPTGGFLTLNSRLEFYPSFNDDYTIETWAWIPQAALDAMNTTAQMCIVGANSTTNGYDTMKIGINSDKQFFFSVFDGSDHIATYTQASIIGDRWYHFAGVKSGVNLMAFVNGKKGAQVAAVVGNTIPAQGRLAIGRVGEWNGGGFYTGNLDELRITAKHARWTDDFTPSEFPLPDHE